MSVEYVKITIHELLPNFNCANCLSKLRINCECASQFNTESSHCSCLCPECLKKDLRDCLGCRLVKYCSKVCQREHWQAGHRDICKILSGKKEPDNVKHEVTSCQACTEEARGQNCSSIKDRRRVLGFYFYLLKRGRHESREDFPLTCPFQLGECTGKFLDWIDESLSRLIVLLRRSRLEISTGKGSELYDNLEQKITICRALYWVCATVSSTKNKGVIENLFFMIIIPTIYGRKSEPTYKVISELNEFGFGSLKWIAFVDYFGFFLQKLRLSKYQMFNLNSIPEKKKEKFSLLSDFSQGYFPEIPDLQHLEALPQEAFCCGCSRDLSGLEAQFQYQFSNCSPEHPGLSQVYIRYPKKPISYDLFCLYSCGDNKDCIQKAIQRQMDLKNQEANLIIDYLTHSLLCQGCLRYSMKTHKCSKCKSVVYCSQQCLDTDWTNHKFACGAFGRTQSNVRASRRLDDKGRETRRVYSMGLLSRLDPLLTETLNQMAREKGMILRK